MEPDLTNGFYDSLYWYPCPELIGNLDTTLTVEQAAKLVDFDGTNLVSLDNELRAVKFVNYIIQNPSTPEALTSFQKIYAINDMYSFFDSMRGMTQNWLLGGATQKITLGNLIRGYYDRKVVFMYNDTSIYEGNELILSAFVSPVFNEPSVVATKDMEDLQTLQMKGLYTGSLNLGNVSKVGYVNGVNFISTNVSMFDGK
jgi:hypothetical protein